ncbi:MAG: PAS domain S-box protein [Chloroflexia bacterium]|nr:PAS domain S-box protein [Chloroflexia bacterium]
MPQAKTMPEGSPEHQVRRLRSFLQAMEDIIIVIGRDGRYLDVAPTRQHLLYRPAEDIIGKTPYELFPPEEADFFHTAVRKTIETGQVTTIEYMLPIADEERWFQGRISPILDEQGQASAALLVAQDVTERWQTWNALRESEERYRTLFEQSNDGIYLLFDGRFVLTNTRFEEMFEISREQVRSPDFSFLELIASKSRPMIQERDNKIDRGEPVPLRYEFTALTAGGREFQAETSVSYIPYRGGLATQGVVRDITVHKQALEALSESEERYRHLVEFMPLGLAIHQDGRLCMINQAGVDMLGYDSDQEMLGRPALEAVHPEDHPQVLERMKHLAAGCTVPWQEERFLRKDGSIVNVEVQASALNYEGRPAVLVVVRDVSERRQLEAQLRQAQKMEAIGRLAGGVAHDFNNLLTAIGGYSELLLGSLKINDPLRHEAEAIREAVVKASQLTQQLLTFSRRQVISLRVVNLNHVLQGLEQMLQRLIGEDIRLKVIPDPQLGNARMDPQQMEQVIVNLVVNAREAMPSGGLLTLETANVELDESYTRHHAQVQAGDYILLSISDTGSGIFPEVQEHIFEPFFTTKEEGTGLGLAIVYGIVKQFNGHIQVYSEVGQGTTFKIYLPRVDQVVQPETPLRQQATWSGGSETILVVEDSDMVRRLTTRILRRLGYQILEAENGDQALDMVASCEGAVDLLLTDVVMPHMSGLVLADKIRQRYPELRVLYMSGYTNHFIAQHGMLQPGSELVQKPFTPQELARKVRTVLESPLPQGGGEA